MGLRPFDPSEPSKPSEPTPRGVVVLRGAAGAAMAALLLAGQACGSGLSYTIDESKVRDLVGAPAEMVREARTEVDSARSSHEARQAEHAEAKKRLAEARDSAQDAGRAVTAAQQSVTQTERGLDKELSDARERRDRAIAQANATYDKEVAQARASFGQKVRSGQAEVRTAEQEQRLRKAQEAWERALLEERKAREEAADAGLWVARAKYELAKFDALAEARGESGPEVDNTRRNFVGQVTERERTLADRERRVAEREKATAAAKAEVDRLSPRAPTAE